jgi:SnoaL-like protein
VPAELGARLIDAVAAQDEAALAECFAPAAEFRALTPRGLRERTGADEVSALISRWFGDSTELQLLDSESAEVGDRLHVSYRFAGVEDGEAYVVEQHLFGTVSAGRIMQADLLCSGFRPRTAVSA